MPAYYAKRVQDFLKDSTSSIIGDLTQGNAQASFCHLETAQTESWAEEADILKAALIELRAAMPHAVNWGILLEYPIPRRQKRIDAALLAGNVIVVLEFKCGFSGKESEGFWQVEDYALDLADFHEPSRDRVIVPVLIAKNAKRRDTEAQAANVKAVVRTTPAELGSALKSIVAENAQSSAPQLDLVAWDSGRYRPVPTVVEAALAIFAGMEVREIAHSHTEASNLTATVDHVLKIVRQARQGQLKVICFVTGVPGSGKTLAGLRAVHDPSLKGFDGTDPAFMSGNGPLVRVLREALARDLKRREEITKRQADRSVCTLIQNIHEFARDNYQRGETQPPHEKIIVFDEAQRAWNAEKNRKKFKREISEPSMILKVMDRHADWAVIVALIGGGQEIHDGEAGLGEWGRALRSGFAHWKVFASPEALSGGQSVAGSKLFDNAGGVAVVTIPELHLPVSTRSYKAEAITIWSNALLEGKLAEAALASNTAADFPVYLTRNLKEARNWLRSQTRGTARCGLVASSGAARLRAYGIEISSPFHRDYPYELWFLNGRNDVRSSYQLEVVATEFEIQGLELDWVGLCWGGDLIWNAGQGRWAERDFRGTSWVRVKKAADATYLHNKYRVLLTRARQGTVIWVPAGDPRDGTLCPEEYDATADALRRSGAKPLYESALVASKSSS